MEVCEYCKGVGDRFTDEEGWFWYVCPKCKGDGIIVGTAPLIKKKEVVN